MSVENSSLKYTKPKYGTRALKLIKEECGDGIVCAVGGGRVFVAPLAAGNKSGGTKKSVPLKERCGSSNGGCGDCGGCLFADPVRDGYVGRFHVDVKDPGKYRPGDRIRFRRFVPDPNLAGALIFGIPILFALTTALLWIAKAPDRIESAFAVFTVIAAFLIGIVIMGMIDGIFKYKYPSTIIDAYDNGT